MQIVFIIGGIGSGKSSVSDLLGILGAKRIDLDKIGHQALEDKATIKKLVSAFGTSILADKRTIDRKSLAAQAFLTDESVLRLNTITFPKIAELLVDQIEELAQVEPDAVVVVEASSFDPTKYDFAVQPDILLAITAPEELRIARAVKAGFDEADARRRNRMQPSDEQRSAWADHVIENDASFEELQHEVATFWDEVII